MESSELKIGTSPPKVDHHDAVKAPPPQPTSDEDDISPTSSSSDDDDEGKSKKPPKPEGSTQPPPNQEMERSPSGYRIPASVFERNKSSTPADWSVASNESLFSIHMGNMSFTNDQYTWRSGELAPPPAPASDQMFCYSAHSSNGGAADMRSRDLGLAEATMLEVIKENEGRSPRPLPPEVRNARRSAGSNQSNMSFAFSVAGGDTERIPSSIKSSVSGRAQGQPENNPEAQQDVQSPAAKQKAAPPPSKWLFCCPCFSFCS